MTITLNLILRFVLELCALVAAGTWGFSLDSGWALRILLGVGVPVVIAAAWGVFRIPNDGGAPVVTVGPWVRLALEAVFFVVAVWLLASAGYGWLALVFAVAILINYAIVYPRTLAMLSGHLPEPS